MASTRATAVHAARYVPRYLAAIAMVTPVVLGAVAVPASAHSGGKAGEAAVAASIDARDRSDTTRTVSPLTVAADAVHIDTTGMPIDQVVDTVMRLVNSKIRDSF